MISHPPQIQSFAITHSVKLRYVTNGVFSGPITIQNLLDTIDVATTAIAPFNLFQQVKIKQIEVWTIAALGTAVSTTVVFSGESGAMIGDMLAHTDTSMGIEPAHLKVRPSTRSSASLYQGSSTEVAFTLACPAGSVVDISLSYRGSVASFTLAAQNASVGAPVGSTFFRGLDGKAVATTTFLLPTGIAQF